MVLDISEPLDKVEKKNKTCQETIQHIGASGVPIITALNKIDQLTEAEAKEKLEALKDKTKNPILISALKGTNLDALRREILKKLEGYVQASFTVPLVKDTMSLISWVHAKTDLKKIKYTQDSVEATFEADPEVAEKVKSRVEELNGKFEKQQTANNKQQQISSPI